jgi:hypothetical protein
MVRVLTSKMLVYVLKQIKKNPQYTSSLERHWRPTFFEYYQTPMPKIYISIKHLNITESQSTLSSMQSQEARNR